MTATLATGFQTDERLTHTAILRAEDGTVLVAPASRWFDEAEPAELRALARVVGPALDIGCGPGRHVAALTERAGAAFWIAPVVGGGIMAFGIWGALDNLSSFPDVATWVIGADLIHDFVVAPIAIAVGWAVGRVVPMRWRAPIQAGLMATGITVAIGWPGLRATAATSCPTIRRSNP